MYRDLKTEFNAIQSDYIGSKITPILIQEIDYRYKELFTHFGLEDLQYRITKKEKTIVFIPIRLIDQYAIYGIITL